MTDTASPPSFGQSLVLREYDNAPDAVSGLDVSPCARANSGRVRRATSQKTEATAGGVCPRAECTLNEPVGTQRLGRQSTHSYQDVTGRPAECARSHVCRIANITKLKAEVAVDAVFNAMRTSICRHFRERRCRPSRSLQRLRW